MTAEQQLPEGWEYVPFNMFFNVVSISDKKISQKEYLDNGKYPVIDQGNLFIGGYSNDESLILKISSPVIVFGDHTKCFKYVSFPFVAGADGIKVLEPQNGIYPKYAYYYCLSIDLTDRGYSRHFAFLKKCQFLIVPIETQQAIVNKIESLFDEIDEGIGRLKTAAQQIQQYRQSLLKNAFNGELTKEWRSKHADTLPSENELLAQIQTTREQHHAQQLADWQNVTIGEVVTISPKKETAIDDNTDVSFSSMHLMSSSISEHLTYEIKKWADVKKGFTIFRNNDVLLAKITPCFENGKSAVAQDLINGIGTGSTEFMVLRCSNQLLPKFLYFLINTPDFRQAGIHNMTGSVGHKRVPKDFVSSWTFSLPSLTEQTQIVAILESKLTACDQLAAGLAKQLKQAELLKQVVLKAAFSGSLLDK